jgi:hypothetical protein
MYPRDKSRAIGVRRVCRTCTNVRQVKYNNEHRDSVRRSKKKSYSLNRERYSENAKKTASRRRGLLMVRGAKTRAKESSLPFDLDEFKWEIQRRVDAGVCELTGIPFSLDGGRKWNTPSIDRIVPSLGYVYSNVRVVCRAINCMLGDWGSDVMLDVLRSYLSFQNVSLKSHSQ